MSRHKMLKWMTSSTQKKYTKIEQLASGVAYCELVNILFKNVIPVKKINHQAKLEHQFISNWKLLQTSFRKVGVEKQIPIERLVKSKFKDNFEFCQWFKKFYDSKYNGGNDVVDINNYNKVSNENGPICGQRDGKLQIEVKNVAGTKRSFTRNITYTAIPAAQQPAKNRVTDHNAQETEEELLLKQAMIKQLKFEITELKVASESVEEMRNFYFEKIKEIDFLCRKTDPREFTNNLDKKIIAVLISADNEDT